MTGPIFEQLFFAQMPNSLNWDGVLAFSHQLLSGTLGVHRHAPETLISSHNRAKVYPQAAITSVARLCSQRAQPQHEMFWHNAGMRLLMAATTVITETDDPGAVAACETASFLARELYRGKPWTDNDWLSIIHRKDEAITLLAIHRLVVCTARRAAYTEVITSGPIGAKTEIRDQAMQTLCLSPYLELLHSLAKD